jgi:cGMP-dependent protein kinase
MVVHRFTGVVYAMKCMSKSLISQHGQQQHVENERTIMQQIDHWACVKMICAYRDKATLYILLEMVQGGELFRYLDQKGRLPEKTVCFYAANVYLALDHLHSKGVIHRDLKPENLLIDPDGYIKLVDFGFAKHVGSGSTYTICGTPDYQAPEVVLRKGHDCMSDYWGLGILIYEMLVGSTPFKTKTDNPRDTFRNILQGVYTIPMFVSDQATDMVMRLLQHDPNKRLGRVGRDEVRSHPFFAGIDWDALEKRQLEAPYLPPISSLNDMTNFDQYHDQAIPVSQYDDTNDTVWRGWGHCNPDQKPK